VIRVPARLLTAYLRHVVRSRGRSLHAIPVDTARAHRCHPNCPCRPRQVEWSTTRCKWHGVWEHNL
jgi:hypothetical protein